MAAIIPPLHQGSSQKKFLTAFQFFPRLPLSQVRAGKEPGPNHLGNRRERRGQLTAMAVISTGFDSSSSKQVYSGGGCSLAETHWGSEAASRGETVRRGGEANAAWVG